MQKLALLFFLASLGLATAAPPNWSGDYRPCHGYPDLLKREHVELGVRIATSNAALARQFAKAVEFWSGIVDFDWHEADAGCSMQVVDGAPELFGATGTVARSQYPDRDKFQGWIAFNPRVPLSDRDLFLISVHEIGHLLGLPHNPRGASVMFFLQLDGSAEVDASDLLLLQSKHKLRDGVSSKGRISVAPVAARL